MLQGRGRPPRRHRAEGDLVRVVGEGLLDRATYEPTIRKGWSALVRAVHPNGMLGYVQRIGDQPGATSASGTEIYGVGGFLLAGSEVNRLAIKE